MSNSFLVIYLSDYIKIVILRFGVQVLRSQLVQLAK